jgi:hypothetical protein
MSFDAQKFLSTSFVPRTEEVKMPELGAFFQEGEAPIFLVQGLTGEELALVHEAAEKNKNVAAILEGIISPAARDKVDAIRKAIGITESVPNEIAKRLEIIIKGCVSPRLDLETAVKICKCFPIDFYVITNTINKLTGSGFVEGKPKPSGGTNTLS